MGTVIKLPKKSDLQECANCRGITLFESAYKVLCHVILNRLQQVVDNKLRDE